jgi:hypothetical protein
LRGKGSGNVLLGDHALVDQFPEDASCAGLGASLLDLVLSQ